MPRRSRSLGAACLVACAACAPASVPLADGGTPCAAVAETLGSPGTLVGQFALRFYWMAEEPEPEVDAASLTPLCDSGERTIAVVAEDFADACRVEGTCRLADGRTLNAGRPCGCAGGLCFRILDARRFPWGKGSDGGALVPFRSVAVDTDLVPVGAQVYLPEMDGLRLPGRGEPHDGCVTAADVGGSIRGLEMDVFVARRGNWLRMRRRLPASASVYVDSPRCADAPESVRGVFVASAEPETRGGSM